MKYAHEKECEVAGLDPAEIERLAKMVLRANKLASKLGVIVFGGSTTTIRVYDDSCEGQLIVASMTATSFDGGDGGIRIGKNGLQYGE